MSSSRRIAYCAAEQSRTAAEHARDNSNTGQPPGSARGPGPDAKVPLPEFFMRCLCRLYDMCVRVDI